MATRREIDPEDLTLEDRSIWLLLTGKGGRLYATLSIWENAAIADERDARNMLWIQKQASFAARQDRKYGRGKGVRTVRPLARIGMCV
jgi:hypothetical protein